MDALPRYSDAVRKETGLPVYDAITCANMFMAGSAAVAGTAFRPGPLPRVGIHYGWLEKL